MIKSILKEEYDDIRRRIPCFADEPHKHNVDPGAGITKI